MIAAGAPAKVLREIEFKGGWKPPGCSSAALDEQRGADGAAQVAELGDLEARRAVVHEEVLVHLLLDLRPVLLAEAGPRARRRG